MGGINTRISDYLLASSDSSYDAIALCETWLNGETISNQIFGTIYNVFRLDRNTNNSKKLSGGGVLLALRASLKARQLLIPDTEAVEQIWVAVSFKSHTLYICVVYIPPDRTQDPNVIDQHIRSLSWITSRMQLKDTILIVGDFNLPNIKWKRGTSNYLYPDVAHSSISSISASLLDYYNLAGVYQFSHLENNNGRMLDLCFGTIDSSIYFSVIEAPSPLVSSSFHHSPLLITATSSTPCLFSDPVESIYYDFNKGNYSDMNSFFDSLNWHEIIINMNVNLAVTTVSNIMLYGSFHMK